MNKETNTTIYQAAGKSDGPILPEKQANKIPLGMAESVVERGSTKRNSCESDRAQTQNWESTMLRLARVRKAAQRDGERSFTALAHYLTPGLLEESFKKLSRKAKPGVDGMTWAAYELNLDINIVDLYSKLRSGRYKPKPARRVFIPKEDGTTRPLSILCLEDKIAQQALVTILNQIYETDFLGFSYGFRPKRGQHDALDALAVGFERRKVNWVLDLDIQKFLDVAS